MDAAIRDLYAEIRSGRLRPEDAAHRIEVLKRRSVSGVGIRNVSSSQIYSGEDVFLQDHTLGGVPVLIGVAHASLAVRAFFEWFPDEQCVHVQQLTFVRPVELARHERAEVRVRRSGDQGAAADFTVQFRIAPRVEWEATATGRMQRSELSFGKMPASSLHGALQPATDLAGIYAAGEPHFKVGDSFRVIRQLYCGETEALAQLDLSRAAGSGAGAYELHPLVAYSAFTAVLPLLVAAGFRDGFLPFGIKSLHFRRGYALDRCWLLVRLVKNSGELALFDADVVTPEFDLVAELRGCSVKRLRTDPVARIAPPIPAPDVVLVPTTSDGADVTVQRYLLRKLDLADESVDLDANLMELGLASAQLVGLAAEIQSELGIEVEPTLFFEYPNLRELTVFFAREHGARFLNAPVAKANEATVARADSADERATDAPVATSVSGGSPRPNDSLQSEAWPLSEGQKGLWALQQASPDMTAYHCPLCFRLQEALDPGLFEAACRFVLRQHPVLAAGIEVRDGVPWFVSRSPEHFVLERVDAAEWIDARIRTWIDAAIQTPFDLLGGPLMRGALLAVAPGERVAVFVIHHVAFDGASFGLFVEALSAAYQALRVGESPRLPRVAVTLADYVQAENRQLSGSEGAKRLAYWREQLAGVLPQLDIYTDYPRALAKLHAGAVVSAQIPPNQGCALKAFALRNAVYPSALFLGAFKQLLHLGSRQDDVIVGMPATERSDARFRPLIGYLVNMIPLRSRAVGGRSFVDLVKDVQRTMATGLAHRYPFPALVRELNLSASGHPVFQAAFEYQNFLDVGTAEQARDANARMLPIEWIEGLHQRGEYELALEVYERGDGFELNLKFNPTLLHSDSARRMLERIEAILERGVKTPEQMIEAPALLSERERTTLLREWNDTRAEYPKHLCIHQWFERQAVEKPENVAVSFRDEALNYGELEKRSRRLALELQHRGVRPDAIVGLCVERSFEMLVGILGILRAGGAYMPLDPEYPDERLQFMVRDSHTRWILTQAHLAEQVGRIGGAAEALLLDSNWSGIEADASTRGDLRQDVQPHHLACVIYTSGSTGNPKGVMVEHESLCNRITWMQRAYKLTARDAVLQKTPFSFDVSGWEFHWPLLVGARLIMAEPGKHRDPEYIRDVIQARGVTVLHFVPSMLQAFLAVDDLEKKCRGLRLAFCSGEELTVMQKNLFFERFKATELHNLYGPTEAAIDVTAWRCREDAVVVPIGKPISNVRLYIVDAKQALLPAGFAGELCLAGDCLARGYLNRPELTAERFVENPFEPEVGRMYRTGDLARWLPDGEVQYLGRIDHQVKIRGFRIELGEIENALARVEGIEQAVVVVADNASGGKRLVAYLGAASVGLDETQRGAADLRSLLRQRLPDYMIPSVFVRLDPLPLTASGKIDRRALAQRPVPPAAPHEDTAPRNEIEARLQALWKRELKVAAVGIHDSFFELGGHSLLALSLIGRVNAEFGARLPLATLFEARSIAELADRLAGGAPATPHRHLITLQPGGERAPIHLVPGVGGNNLSFLPLSRALGEEQPVIVFQYPGLEEGSGALASVPALAEFFVEQLLQESRQSQYTLGGWSLGGVVAFEMARLLEQRGIGVRLMLLDSYLAEHFERFAELAESAPTGQSSLEIQTISPVVRTGEAEMQRRVEALIAAGERALRGYRAGGIFRGDAVVFFAANQARLNGHARNGSGDGEREISVRAAEATREIWQRYLPRMGGRFFMIEASHETIVEEPAATAIASRIRDFMVARVAEVAGPEPVMA